MSGPVTSGFGFGPDGLAVRGVPLGGLADRVGTPTYVYDIQGVRERVWSMRSAFSGIDPAICYAVKANGCGAVLRAIEAEGCGADVVSGGELHRAVACGFGVDRIVFAGVGKTDEELLRALGATGEPPMLINVESREELSRLAAIAADMGVRPSVAVRVNPDVDAGSHPHISTGRKGDKFGVGADEAAELFAAYGGDRRVHVRGLHAHVGSMVREPGTWAEVVRRLLELTGRIERAGGVVDRLDIGGGVAVSYDGTPTPPDAAFAEAMPGELRERVRDGMRVIIEPGRSLVAASGVLLTRVVCVKDASGRRMLVCDAGMNALIRPALYGAEHAVWPVGPGRGHRPEFLGGDAGRGELQPYDIVGPICESTDVLARGRMLPEVRAGDLLAVFTTGAYGMSMAMTFNDHALPAEVTVDGGVARLVRPRLSVEELVAASLGEGRAIDLSGGAS